MAMNGDQPPDPLAAFAGAADLNRPFQDESAEALEWAEQKVHMRCGGCGARFQKGFLFVKVTVMRDPVTRVAMVQKAETVSCAAPDCDHAIVAAQDATAVRKLHNEWLFMDDLRIAEMFAAAGEETDVSD